MSKQQKIRVLIVEDYAPLLQQLKAEINLSPGMKCVGTFQTCEEALKAIEAGRARPDVILMDLGLPTMDGIGCTREIKRRWPRVKVIVLSGDEARETIVKALGAGADGYLDKQSSPRQKVAAAIERVHEGEPALSATALRETIGFFHVRPELLQRLSPQEKKVLDEYKTGARQKEIADRLGITQHTVREYIRRICQKTGVDRMAAAAFVRKQVV